MSLPSRRKIQAPAPNKWLRFDIEADGFAYITIDRKGKMIPAARNVWVMWVQDLYDGSYTGYRGDSILEGVRRLWAAEIIRGHNIIQYDIPVLERVTGLKKPASVKTDDSLIRSRVLWPESYNAPMGGNDLDSWGEYLEVRKGKFNGPWDKWTQEMDDYCHQDVTVHEAIDETLDAIPQNEQAVQIEFGVTAIISRQSARGWRFDLERARRTIADLEIERAGILDELQKAFPPKQETTKTPEYWSVIAADGVKAIHRGPTKGECERWLKAVLKEHGKRMTDFKGHIEQGPMRVKLHPFNPGSGDQIAERLTERYKWKPTEMTDGGSPKTDYDVLVKLPYPEVKALLRYAENEKLLDALIDYERRAAASPDGRIHGTINVQGAVTGRMTHNQPNTGNVPKDKRVRSCFIPSEGMSAVGGDAAGLELRMLANRMARWDSGAYGKVLLEGDIHDANTAILRTVVKEITRDGGKTFIYGWLYGAGDAKIGKIVGRDARVGRLMKETFLKKLPALAKLIQYLKSRVTGEGSITLLDGRQVPVRHQHAVLNTQLQGDGAMVMKVALLILDRKLQSKGYVPGVDYEFLGNIHDEFQMEARPEIAKDVGETIVWAIQEAGRRLKCVIRLDGAYKIGASWAETH